MKSAEHGRDTPHEASAGVASVAESDHDTQTGSRAKHIDADRERERGIENNGSFSRSIDRQVCADGLAVQPDVWSSRGGTIPYYAMD